MPLITTNTGRTILKKAESMMIVPYVYDSTVGDYVLGSDVYDISAIVGDTISLEQSDGETTTKRNEFVGSPLLEIRYGGKYEITARCIDLQNKVVKALFGAMTVSGNDSIVAFNDDFVPLYVLVRIRFEGENLPDVFLPKVELNSKLIIEQLKSNVSNCNINGTSVSRKCAIQNDAATAVLQFSSPVYGNTYTPYTPVLFVPRNKIPLFYRNKGTVNADAYTSIDFTNGTLSNRVVDSNTGTLY